VPCHKINRNIRKKTLQIKRIFKNKDKEKESKEKDGKRNGTRKDKINN
jgi:hypothetical protein